MSFPRKRESSSGSPLSRGFLGVAGKMAFGVQRCHAAGARGGYRLAVDLILHIAAGKNAGNAGFGGPGLGFDVADLIQLDLAF